MDQFKVSVDVTNVWSDPSILREVDALMTHDQPAHAAWLEAMDSAETEGGGRDGLDPALDTQAVRGEPVQLLEEREDGWARVQLPWQPHDGGLPYSGWVRRAHLTELTGDEPSLPPAHAEPRPEAVIEHARRMLGSLYLWGGTSDEAVDCSGLIHTTLRYFGIVVPRDAHVQREMATSIPIGEEQPGDLYFFTSRADRTGAEHVGFVVHPGVLLHSPTTGQKVTEEEMPAKRRETLVAVGRVLG